MVLGAQASMVMAARANFTLGPHTENHTGPTLEQRVTALENTVIKLEMAGLHIEQKGTHIEQKGDWIVTPGFASIG